MLALLPILLVGAQGAGAAPAPAPSGRLQIFIAPSGEPFRVNGSEPYPVARWFAGADKNGDGKLDKDEFVADFLRFFDQLDLDHDGAIDGVERARYENEVAPETLGGSSEQRNSFADEPDDSDVAGEGSAAPTDAPKPRYGASPSGAGRFDLFGMPEPVAAMDTELRGRISERAVRAAARLRFDVLDGQHLGYLTLATLPPSYAEGRNSATGKLRMSHDRGDNTRGH